jgi:hypothetical protein
MHNKSKQKHSKFCTPVCLQSIISFSYRTMSCSLHIECRLPMLLLREVNILRSGSPRYDGGSPHGAGSLWCIQVSEGEKTSVLHWMTPTSRAQGTSWACMVQAHSSHILWEEVQRTQLAKQPRGMTTYAKNPIYKRGRVRHSRIFISNFILPLCRTSAKTTITSKRIYCNFFAITTCQCSQHNTVRSGLNHSWQLQYSH